jgi:hypothetical protein
MSTDATSSPVAETKKSFEEQFPGYDIKPIKKPSKLITLAYLVIAIGSIGGLIGSMLYLLSINRMPQANMATVSNPYMSTLAAQGITLSKSGDHHEAIKALNSYFSLGGNSSEAMVAFAQSLAAKGQTEVAIDWATKAAAINPKSQTAKFLKELLEKQTTK